MFPLPLCPATIALMLSSLVKQTWLCWIIRQRILMILRHMLLLISNEKATLNA